MGYILAFKPLEEEYKEKEILHNENDAKLFDMVFKIKDNLSEEKLAILDIHKIIKKMYKKYEADKIAEKKTEKWKHAAIVLDRFF